MRIRSNLGRKRYYQATNEQNFKQPQEDILSGNTLKMKEKHKKVNGQKKRPKTSWARHHRIVHHITEYSRLLSESKKKVGM